MPGGRATIFTSKPWRTASSIPRRAADCAGGVAVEGEPEPLRETAELAKLVLGQGRAHTGDDRLEPGLTESDHVGVSLDDAGPVGV